MRALVPLFAVLGLAAWLVLRSSSRRDEFGDGNATLGVVEADPTGRPEVALLPAPAPLVEEAAPEGSPARREAVVVRTEPVAGRVEVAGGLPFADQPVVVAHVHRTGVSRLHSRRIEAPVARDGSFALEVPAGTRSVSLDLESLVLWLSEEVEVRPGQRDVVLRPEVRAALRGWAHRPGRLALGPSSCEEEPIRVSCDRAGTLHADPGGGFVFMVPTDTELVLEAEIGTGGFVIRADTPIFLAAETGTGEAAVEAAEARASARLVLEALRPGEIREVDLFLEPWIAPRGVVTDRSGAPIEGASVMVVLSEEQLHQAWQPGVKQTGVDGRVLLDPLPPGPWELWVTAPGRFRDLRKIVLPSDGYEELRFVLGPPGIVRGRVVLPDGTPCEGAIVSDIQYTRRPPLFEHVGTGESTPTTCSFGFSQSGFTSLACTDGEGGFTFVADTDAALLVAVGRGFAASLPLEVELGAGVEKNGVVLQLRRACSLSGRAFDEDGKPLLKTLLRFHSADGTDFMLDTGASGTFEAHGLPAGSARISAGFTRVGEGFEIFARYRGSVDVELVPGLEHEQGNGFRTVLDGSVDVELVPGLETSVELRLKRRE